MSKSYRTSERESFILILAVVAVMAYLFGSENTGKKNFFQRCWQATKDAAVFAALGTWIGASYVYDKLKSAAGAIKNFFSTPAEVSNSTPAPARVNQYSDSTRHMNTTLGADNSNNKPVVTNSATISTTPRQAETRISSDLAARKEELQTQDVDSELSYSPRVIH